MPLIDEMNEMETRLKARGQSVTKLCEAAGLARSTWDRWKREETGPNLKSWHAIKSAMESIAPTASDCATQAPGKDAA